MTSATRRVQVNNPRATRAECSVKEVWRSCKHGRGFRSLGSGRPSSVLSSGAALSQLGFGLDLQPRKRSCG